MPSTRNRKRGHVPRDVLYPPLSEVQILEWADPHFARSGQWPLCTDGARVDAARENWRALNTALQQGFRGLQGGNFSTAETLEWARASREEHDAWPTYKSGPIAAAPDETWVKVDSALHRGGRGLPGGTTLRRFLSGHE